MVSSEPSLSERIALNQILLATCSCHLRCSRPLIQSALSMLQECQAHKGESRQTWTDKSPQKSCLHGKYHILNTLRWMSSSLPTLKISDEDGLYAREKPRNEIGVISAESYLDLNRPFKLDI